MNRFSQFAHYDCWRAENVVIDLNYHLEMHMYFGQMGSILLLLNYSGFVNYYFDSAGFADVEWKNTYYFFHFQISFFELTKMESPMKMEEGAGKKFDGRSFFYE